MKTVIIGGGISGLSAAYTLQKNSVDFVLLEAGKQTGGRTDVEGSARSGVEAAEKLIADRRGA